MRLALVISSLGGGGAERVMSVLANAWASRGEDVTLITIGSVRRDVYHLNQSIERVGLDLLRPSGNAIQGLVRNLYRLTALRAEIRRAKPDLVVSFMTNTNILTTLSCFGLGIPVVVSEHTALSEVRQKVPWRLLFSVAYKCASGIVALNQRCARFLEARVGRPVMTIPNPVVVPPTAQQANVSGSWTKAGKLEGTHRLLAMGRLNEEKGFDLLLTAFANLVEKHPDWVLTILGEGAERHRLERQVRELGLGGRVELPGFEPDPWRVMRASEAFVLSSRYEGMPSALMEAMACGLPCVSFDCPTGPADLIESGVSGLLVRTGDVMGLSHALGRIMADARLRTRLGEAAVAIRARYGLDGILAQWDAAFEVASRRSSGILQGCIRPSGFRKGPVPERTRSDDV